MQLKQARLMIFNLCLIAVSMYYAALSAAYERYFLSGCILFVTGFILFALYYRSTKNYLNARGIFLTSWFISIGLAALKLHSLEKQWSTETWICLGVTPLMFLLGYEMHYGLIKRHGRIRLSSVRFKPFHMIVGLSAAIFLVFAVEAVACRGVPLINRGMGNYAEFGLPYLHYITVSCVLVTPLSLVFFYRRPPLSKRKRAVVLLCNLVMMSIPILIVSRQLLIMEAFLIFATFIQLTNVRRISLKFIIILIIILSAAWILFSLVRQQTAKYLVMALKLSTTSLVFLAQAVMYIAGNFDNFDLMVGHVDQYTFGYRSFEPLWTFTMLKAFFPKTIREATMELIMPVFNTFPFIAWPYSDFGIAGVIVYSLLVGVGASIFEGKVNRNRRGLSVVSNSLFLYCLLLSFFSPFLSFTSVWTYFIILFLVRELTLPPKDMGRHYW